MQENKKPEVLFYGILIVVLFISFATVNFNFYKLYKLQQQTLVEIKTTNSNLSKYIDLTSSNTFKQPERNLKLEDTLAKGQQAPTFKLRSLDNKYYSIRQYLNSKNILLVAWIPTCPYCRAFMPKLESFYKKNKNTYAILSVSRIAEKDDVSRLLRGIKDLNITLPVLLSEDKTDTFGYDYKLRSVPTLWLINKKLQVVDILQKDRLGKINLDQLVKKSFPE